MLSIPALATPKPGSTTIDRVANSSTLGKQGIEAAHAAVALWLVDTDIRIPSSNGHWENYSLGASWHLIKLMMRRPKTRCVESEESPWQVLALWDSSALDNVIIASCPTYPVVQSTKAAKLHGALSNQILNPQYFVFYRSVCKSSQPIISCLQAIQGFLRKE